MDEISEMGRWKFGCIVIPTFARVRYTYISYLRAFINEVINLHDSVHTTNLGMYYVPTFLLNWSDLPTIYKNSLVFDIFDHRNQPYTFKKQTKIAVFIESFSEFVLLAGT